MRLKEKEPIRRQLSLMVDEHKPAFQDHGVKCELQFHLFSQPIIEASTRRHRLFKEALDWIGSWLRKIITGKNAKKSERPEKMEVWCAVLRFSPTDNNDIVKEYAFVLRTKDRRSTHSFSSRRVTKAMTRLLARKQARLAQQDALKLCTDTWWDVFRYLFGNYWYKDTAKGLDLGLLRLGLFITVLVIFGLIELLIDL